MLIFAAMTNPYYSIRMHAERDELHLSGAERLVPAAAVERVTQELIGRAFNTPPGAVRISVDLVDSSRIVFGAIPDVTLVPKADYLQGRQQAVGALIESGVQEKSALAALAAIAAGASPDGHAMRGAMLVDAVSGERLEPDRHRGVRATRLDIMADAEVSLHEELHASGLQHLRTREALVLAAKVLAAPGVVAELCWSDAADYTAGYVASQQVGYRRFPNLKQTGDLLGGRAFFVRPGFDLDATVAFLQQTPFLVQGHGRVKQMDEMQ